jgi:hypothetical protein
MSAWASFVLLGTFLAILASESVLLYASTALGNVGLKFGKWLLASSLAAVVWAAIGCCCVALIVYGGQAFPLNSWGALAGAAAGGLFVSWLVPGLLFAWTFSTSAWRGMLVSTYQLLLRALTCLLVGATAVLLLRLFLAASATARGGD